MAYAVSSIGHGKRFDAISWAVRTEHSARKASIGEHDGNVNDQLQNTVADDVPGLQFQNAEKWEHPEPGSVAAALGMQLTARLHTAFLMPRFRFSLS
jgi:hypothetical protein